MRLLLTNKKIHKFYPPYAIVVVHLPEDESESVVHIQNSVSAPQVGSSDIFIESFNSFSKIVPPP